MSGNEVTSVSVTRNAVINALAILVNLIMRFFLPPLVLSYLSLSEYGLWSYCFILIGYIGMSVFGFSSVYVRFTSLYAANNDIKSINSLVSTGIFTIGVTSILLSVVLYFCYPLLFSKLPIDSHLQDTAFYLIYGTTCLFLIDLTTNVFSYVLQGLQKFKIERSIFLFASSLEFVSIFIFLHLGFGIYSLMFAYGLRILAIFTLSLYYCLKLIPDLEVSPSFINKETFKNFWHFGGIIQLTGLIGTFNVSIEKMFAGIFLGPRSTALYDIGEKLPITIAGLAGSASWTLLPASTHLETKNEFETIRKFYLQASRWVNILTSLPMGFIAPFSSAIITCWLGTNEKYHDAAFILSVFTIAYQINTLTGPASATFRGINKPQRELFYGLCELFCVLTCALIVFPLLGVTITTINYVVATMMILGALIYIFNSNMFFKTHQVDYLGVVLAPGLVSYGVGYGLEWLTHFRFAETATDRWQTLILLLVALMMYLTIMIPIIFGILCDSAEREKLKKLIFQILEK